MLEFQNMLFMHSSDAVLVLVSQLQTGGHAATSLCWFILKWTSLPCASVPQLATPTLQLLLSSISPHETAAAAG